MQWTSDNVYRRTKYLEGWDVQNCIGYDVIRPQGGGVGGGGQHKLMLKPPRRRPPEVVNLHRTGGFQ